MKSRPSVWSTVEQTSLSLTLGFFPVGFGPEFPVPDHNYEVDDSPSSGKNDGKRVSRYYSTPTQRKSRTISGRNVKARVLTEFDLSKA